MPRGSRRRGQSFADSLLQLRAEVNRRFGEENEILNSAIACALPAIHATRWDEVGAWLLQSNEEFTCEAVRRLQSAAPDCRAAAAQVREHAGAGDDSLLWSCYELLLNSGDRRTSGTYYTPPTVAHYLIAQAERRLRESRTSFASTASGSILEPACGSGIFFATLLEHLQGRGQLNQSAAQQLLPRLIGIDLSAVAIFLTRLRIALTLQSAGIALAADLPQPRLVTGNALAGPDAIPELRQPIGVVLGNPPFSYLSQNELPWIQSLVRGDKSHAGYFAIDGAALGEKKTWLHDDYVKFLRLAQWCIEQNGRGVVSLVTNHGWLDNATFRIARQQLLRTFSRIDVVDLHGNAKRHEANQAAERDENVFGIAQGIALVTLTKTGGDSRSQVSRADLWGSSKTKLEQLALAIADEPLPNQSIVPIAPWFTFAEQPAELPAEYRAAPLLTELMPVNSTVPVTARDYFVVAATREELQQRTAEFCDSKISDDEIRSKYFQRTRSNRYEPGDTRGWKLPAVRRLLMSEADPASCIRRCLYRPFVWRYVLWHPALIDWPRAEFTRHFDGGNLALIARRQSIAGREANFFWITDCLPLDGVIRSDNRGSESFFPLWLKEASARRANFTRELLAEHDPTELLAYCHSLFHAPSYRTRYTNGLAMEFPRVLLPREPVLFALLARIGQELIALHLTDPQGDPTRSVRTTLQGDQPAIEDFYVGTYNVCRKWLQMQGDSRESAAFGRLQGLIGKTIELQQEIEDAIANAGGFPHAFR
ncbi:type ISP restriction/modification enzyme [Anatilimnocola floriformis]|uniref:type ISP restriction/modification enzyme n=1 Tax=Anatilimnocola floriformis TaxID=2948575 RepID=UPI0020C431D7|nr:type ISP restriction/modification enzyme [Anatilimnocola floriformis]